MFGTFERGLLAGIHVFTNYMLVVLSARTPLSRSRSVDQVDQVTHYFQNPCRVPSVSYSPGYTDPAFTTWGLQPQPHIVATNALAYGEPRGSLSRLSKERMTSERTLPVSQKKWVRSEPSRA